MMPKHPGTPQAPPRNTHRAPILLGLLLASPLALLPGAAPSVAAAATIGSPQITGLSADNVLSWTQAPTPGICTIETAPSPVGPWVPAANVFTTQPSGSRRLPAPAPDAVAGFHRLQALDLPPTPAGFTNLVRAYGLLETVAGTGAGQTDGVSYWDDWFEDEPAIYATLSRPHFALADAAGNIYIADKGSHSILRVSTDGRIHTHAGTHVGGFDGDGPAPATRLQLKDPNGLWVRADGTVYVLDTGNGRVRRVDTDGVMTTLFLTTAGGAELPGGRSVWVSDDETLAYFGAETRVRRWTRTDGLGTVASGFVELGALHVEPSGTLLVCDRGANRAYRVTPAGDKTPIAGNGRSSGGGDGLPALATGLEGVRGVWTLPTGGCLLLTHDGCQLWYADTAGIIHLLLNGAGGRTHAGDGLCFYPPDIPAISEGRSVSLDFEGNILLCESDWGYIRRIRFLPCPP